MYIKIQKLYTYTLERRFTLMLFMGLVGIMGLYVLLIAFTTFNISSQRALQNSIQMLYSDMSDTESEYAELKSVINKDKALSLGFVEPKKELFAFRQRLVQNGF